MWHPIINVACACSSCRFSCDNWWTSIDISFHAYRSKDLPTNIDANAAVQAFKSSLPAMCDSLKNDIPSIAVSLYSKNIISPEDKAVAVDVHVSTLHTRASSLLDTVISKIRENSCVFKQFVEILEEYSCHDDITDRIISEYSKYHVEHGA